MNPPACYFCKYLKVDTFTNTMFCRKTRNVVKFAAEAARCSHFTQRSAVIKRAYKEAQ